MNASAAYCLENEVTPMGKPWKSFWKELLQAPNPNHRKLLCKEKRDLRRRIHRKIRRETRRKLNS